MAELSLFANFLIASLSGVSGAIGIGQFLGNVFRQKSELEDLPKIFDVKSYFMSEDPELKQSLEKLLIILKRADPLIKRLLMYRLIHHALFLAIFLMFLFFVNFFLFSLSPLLPLEGETSRRNDDFGLIIYYIIFFLVIVMGFILFLISIRRGRSIKSLARLAKKQANPYAVRFVDFSKSLLGSFQERRLTTSEKELISNYFKIRGVIRELEAFHAKKELQEVSERFSLYQEQVHEWAGACEKNKKGPGW